jgi:colicin import membrane protein
MRTERIDQPAALQKRRQPGRTRAIVLAVIVHALFFALIVFGVRWQSQPTAPVAADLWSKLPAPQKAAPPPPPKAQPAPPKPQPAPPKPQPAPPKPATPQADNFGPKPPEAEIAESRKRAEQQRLEKQREEQARLEQQREEEARQKKAAEEAAKKKAEQEAAKKKAQQEAARKKREEEEKRLAEQIAKAEQADRERQAAATARQKAIQSWVDKIKAKILNRAIVPDTVPTGAEVAVEIHILPGGDVLDIAVTRSTSPTYSAAIERAIRSAAPLPVPGPETDLFPEFRDLNLNFRHER